MVLDIGQLITVYYIVVMPVLVIESVLAIESALAIDQRSSVLVIDQYHRCWLLISDRQRRLLISDHPAIVSVGY